MKKRSKQPVQTKTNQAPAVTRQPLPPLTGPIGPLPVPAFGRQPSEDLAAERVALRQTEKDGDRTALADVLFQGLTLGNAETPLDLATATLQVLADELHVLHDALEAECEGVSRTANIAFAMAQRAEMVIELCNRIEGARNEPSEVCAPPAHEVAAFVATLSGILSATSRRDRLMRIAERLGATIEIGGELSRAMTERHKAPHSLYFGHNGHIAIDEREPDPDGTIARLLALHVAKREGYGEVSPEWCTEFAGAILDRHEQKGAA